MTFSFRQQGSQMIFAETEPGRTEVAAQMTAGEHRPVVLHLVQLVMIDHAMPD